MFGQNYSSHQYVSFIQPFANQKQIQHQDPQQTITKSNTVHFENLQEDEELDELDQFADKLENERAEAC